MNRRKKCDSIYVSLYIYISFIHTAYNITSKSIINFKFYKCGVVFYRYTSYKFMCIFMICTLSYFFVSDRGEDGGRKKN